MRAETLTDQELLAAPPKLLSKAERKRRRILKNKRAVEKSRSLRRKRMEEGRGKVIYCQGTTKKGDPCGAYAITGAKHCGVHLNSAEEAKLGRKNLTKYANEARLTATKVNGSTLSAPQTARAAMEAATEKLLKRYFMALGIEFQGFDDDGNPILYDKGPEHGLCLYGESKEGYIHVSKHPDLLAQIGVSEKLWDRVYGRPKQTQVLEGGTKPIQVQPVRTVERAQRVANILNQVGALPHEGRRRAEPSEPAGEPEEATVVEETDSEPPTAENVVPLHDQDD